MLPLPTTAMRCDLAVPLLCEWQAVKIYQLTRLSKRDERAAESVFARLLGPCRCAYETGPCANVTPHQAVPQRPSRIAGRPVSARIGWKPVPREVSELFGIRSIDADAASLLIRASPVIYVNRDMPRFLLAHGTKDEDVPCEQSVEMCEKVKAAGGHCSLIAIEAAPPRHRPLGVAPGVSLVQESAHRLVEEKRQVAPFH